MTKYLRYQPGTTSSHIERYALHFQDSLEWVDDIKDTTPDYLPSIEATNDRIAKELGLKTSLVELPDKLGGVSMWVITKED
jgi:hypothetical protein